MKDVAKRKKRKLKKTIIFKSFSCLFIVISILFFIQVLRMKMLPTLYLGIILVVLLLLNVLCFCFVSSKKWNFRLMGILCCLLFSGVLSVGIFYETVTLNFFGRAFQSLEKLENYQVIVLDSSNYGSLREFKNGKIGVPKMVFSKGPKILQDEIKKRCSLTMEEMDNATLVNALLNKSVRVIVMEEAQKNLYEEIDEEFQKHAKVIDTISVRVPNDVPKYDAEILKKSFNVYVSGTDEYGAINQVSRSDVNMIISVNPVSHQILMTSIPRDYYVSLKGMDDAKDKLTHASLYGVDCSIATLEELMQTKIDYYLKINFSSLVGLVEAVDGIDVESETSFTAHYYDEPADEWVTMDFSEGMNHLNGKEALAFSRERKSFALGDRTRSAHQQAVLSALIKKIASPAILKNYTGILRALEGSFDTNFSYENIMMILQKQLEKNSEWNIEANTLEGTDANKPVYSISNATSYVMLPDEVSVYNAQVKIRQVLENS